jgi:hypothetical protein
MCSFLNRVTYPREPLAGTAGRPDNARKNTLVTGVCRHSCPNSLAGRPSVPRLTSGRDSPATPLGGCLKVFAIRRDAIRILSYESLSDAERTLGGSRIGLGAHAPTSMATSVPMIRRPAGTPRARPLSGQRPAFRTPVGGYRNHLADHWQSGGPGSHRESRPEWVTPPHPPTGGPPSLNSTRGELGLYLAGAHFQRAQRAGTFGTRSIRGEAKRPP